MTSIDQNRTLVDQGLQVLSDLADDLYRAPDPTGAAGVGPHLRHCIEFYRAFLHGLDPGEVDYDGRPREVTLETSRSAAVAALGEIHEALGRLAGRHGPQPMKVRVDVAGGSGEPGWCQSTVARELAFLVSHTVHHYALIAQVLNHHGLTPDPELGVAPSTLEHRRRLAEV